MPALVRGDLNQLIETRRALTPFKIYTQILMIIQLASAVDYIHTKNFMHCDISPNNVMIQNFNEDFDEVHLLLTDFGLARN